MSAPTTKLTYRQSQIYRKLCGPVSMAGIAREMHISIPSIQGHVRKICKKKGVQHRIALMAQRIEELSGVGGPN